ncbi:MAG: sugar phosphate isomerase/epimerase [Acidobacteriota bacterium]|nr:sugar phosphate isomerase/epimerase [Acidobacteriota bacterium]
MTRRTALAACGALAAFATKARSQQADPNPKFGRSAPRRTMPMLCGFSGNLAKIRYAELGMIAQQIGYEGIDLTVQIGGHVDPRITNVDLIRAFESVRGAGLEVPMITTDITMASERTTYPVLYLTGHSQIPLFRLGLWRYPGGGDLQQTLLQVRHDVAEIVAVAQRCEITAMFPNRAGFVGESVTDTQTIIGDMNPQGSGYYFDPAEAGDKWEAAFRVALPRLKAISLQDFKWEQADGEKKLKKCPLGEGLVDWQKFFGIAVGAKFTGPISIHMEYKPADEPGSMARDLEFVRKQVQQAWTPTEPRS